MGKYSDRLLTGGGDVAAPKYSERILGGGGPTETPAPEPAKEEGWGEWLANSIRGPQDPAYAGVPSVYSQENVRSPSNFGSMLFGASDAQLADQLKQQFGERFIRQEKDANDYPVIVWRGEDGTERKGYVNSPGLDRNDIARGVIGAAPYIASGLGAGALTKGAGVVGQMAAQGLAALGTSVAGDVAQMPLGSEQFIEPEKALVTGGLGFAGPGLSAAGSALWRRFVTIPGMVDGAGKLTAKGMEAARKAGLDPADMNPDMAKEFAKSYAKSGDEALAAARSSTAPMGIPTTQGQQTKRPFLLNQEEKIRRGLYGEKAEREMLSFDALQRERIEQAAMGGGQKPGVGQTINPSRAGQADRRSMGENVQAALRGARETARQEESKLWEAGGVRALEATDDALATLPDVISRNMADVVVDSRVTPTAARMAQEMDRFISGKAPDQVAGVLKQGPVKSVDQMRRRLLSFQNSAANPEDERAAGRLYDAFNDWIGESAANSLLAGDPMAAAQLVKARAFSREVRQLFSPTDASGQTSVGARRLAKAMQKADSGEGVIQALLGSQGSQTANEGTVTALRQAKSVLDRFGGQCGKQAWDDIRLAYWSRLVTGKNGEVLGPQALTNNIKTALNSQKSVLMTLYKPEEISQMRRLMRATEVAAYKPPNASGSGYTAAEAIKELTGKFLNLVPGAGYIRAGLDVTGVPNAVGAMRARQAMDQAVPVRRPNITPALTGVGSAFSRE